MNVGTGLCHSLNFKSRYLAIQAIQASERYILFKFEQILDEC